MLFVLSVSLLAKVIKLLLFFKRLGLAILKKELFESAALTPTVIFHGDFLIESLWCPIAYIVLFFLLNMILSLEINLLPSLNLTSPYPITCTFDSGFPIKTFVSWEVPYFRKPFLLTLKDLIGVFPFKLKLPDPISLLNFALIAVISFLELRFILLNFRVTPLVSASLDKLFKSSSVKSLVIINVNPSCFSISLTLDACFFDAFLKFDFLVSLLELLFMTAFNSSLSFVFSFYH